MPSACAALGRRTIVFIDEIHRFNKAQQDAFLPYVERGDIILIGATTENPSFEVIAALLSRSRVYALRALTGRGDRGAAATRAGGSRRAAWASWRSPRGRHCWNRSPSSPTATRARPTTRWKPRWPPRRRTNWPKQAVQDAIQRKVLLYDKSGEEHYNLISALHKSVRSSDADAALYWLARMLEAGEDRMYIARRLDAHGDRRHRAGRSARARAERGGHAGRAFSGDPRRRPGAGAGGDLPIGGAQVRRFVSRAGRGAGGRAGDHGGAGPDAPAQRRHAGR